MNKTSVAQQAKTTSFLPAAQGILQRQCACGNHTIAEGKCAECAKKKTGLQRKLAIGASNDPLEQEADRVADQVMAMPLNSGVNHTVLRIQRFTGQASENSITVPASVDSVLASSGKSLEPALRQDMEQRFGHDFSQVQVHTGSKAEQSAGEVNAHAYTVGHSIVFGAGRFMPETYDGRRLIAHELTHVAQQTFNPTSALAQQTVIGIPFSPTETEAEVIAQRVYTDSSVYSGVHKFPVGLQRQPVEKTSDSVSLSSGLQMDSKLFAQMMVMCAEGKLDPIQCVKMRQSAGLLTAPTTAPLSRFGIKPMDLGDRSSNKLPSMAEIQKTLDESNRALGALGVGVPIPAPPNGKPVPNATAQPAPAASSLEELLSFKFQAGPFNAEVELPKSVKLKLPVALTKAKTLTFEIQAESSKTFSAAIRLDGLPHLSVALKAQMNVDKDKGNTGSVGLEIQTTRTVCSADNPDSLKAKIIASGETLTKGMKELETALPDERLEKLVDIVGAIGEMYAAIDKSKKSCKEVPRATFNFGVQGPLSDPSSPDKIDPDPLKRPTPYVGGSITIPF